MSQPTQHYLDCPNLEGGGTHRVSFFDWGNPTSDQVVVCVHGLTRNAHDFDFLARALAGQCRVIAIDMAGRGESEWLANYSLYHYATYMADCLAILDNFHLRCVDWVGTSLGGIVGMMVASFYPGRIRRLVLNDIGAVISSAGLRRIVGYVAATPMFFASEEEAKNRLRDVFASFGVTGEDQWQHVFAHSIKTHPQGGYRLNYDPNILEPLRAETKNFTEVADVDLSELWEGVECATLVVRGSESDILTPETVSAMRAKNLKCQSIEVAGVGHAPTLMSPDQIAPLVSFLGGGAVGVMKRAI